LASILPADASRIIGPSTAARWAYPAGGERPNYSTSVSEPIGAAISNK